MTSPQRNQSEPSQNVTHAAAIQASRSILLAPHSLDLVLFQVVKRTQDTLKGYVQWIAQRIDVDLPAPSFSFAAVVVAVSPAVFLVLPGRPSQPLSYLWLVLVWSWILMALVFSHTMREMAINSRDVILEMFTPAWGSAEMQSLEEWFERANRRPRQIVTIAFSAFFVINMAFLLPSPTVERIPVVFVTLALAGVSAGHALYLVVYACWFCLRFSSFSNLKLSWVSPIDTPGLQRLSKLVQTGARFGLVLLPITAVPLIYGYLHVSNPGHGFIYLGLMSLPLLTLAVFGGLAQVWISEPAHLARMRTLEEVSGGIDKLKSARSFGDLTLDERQELEGDIQTYSTLRNIQQSYLRTELITSYFSALLAAALPLAVAILSRTGA